MPESFEAEESSRRTLIVIFIMSGLIVLAGIASVMYHFVSRISEVAQQKIEQPGVQVTFGRDESRYINTKEGIRLALPGFWIITPGKNEMHCSFQHGPEETGFLYSIPKTASGTMRAYAESLEQQFAPASSFHKIRTGWLTVDGREARMLALEGTHTEKSKRQAMLLVSGEARVYMLIVQVPDKPEKRWEEILSALPHVLSVR